ncbi:MAG: 2Fe-2S iron-sulfur cluster-binding protein [Elainellaceae cyanobacterium]
MSIRLRRRRFGQIALLASLATLVSDRFKAARGQSLTTQEPTTMPTTASIPLTTVSLTINSTPQTLDIEPRVTLLDLLRERLDLTGTKKGCNHGQCGACTVLADGQRINSCLALAMQYEGAEITTIEGLAAGDLHPMQTAFIDNEGFQCGFCTSGQVCSAVALLDEIEAGDASAVTDNIMEIDAPSELTDAEIRERMSGNLCRCGAYPGIVAAINEVQGV